MNRTTALHDALMVLLHDNVIMQHLQANDPQALRQAQAALRPEPQFSQKMLPTLGVMWHQFDTLAEAESFAAWAEAETANDEHPCEAFITPVDHGPGFEVKVRNW